MITLATWGDIQGLANITRDLYMNGMSVIVQICNRSVTLYQQESWIFEKCDVLKLHKLLEEKSSWESAWDRENKDWIVG